MISKPLISVIITAFNSEKYIKESILSVLNQTYENLEIIVVNDGSIDNTEREVSCFSDNRLKYYLQTNKGQSSASNFGFCKSTGAYIKFLDSDDILNPIHIETQYESIKDIPDTLASCSWARFFNNDYKSAVFKPESVWCDLSTIDWIKNALSQKSDMMPGWLWLIPREIYKKIGGWDEKLSLNNDFDFSIRLLLKATNVKFVNNAILYYRSGDSSSLSSTVSEKDYYNAYLCTKIACTNLLNAESSTIIKNLCANRYQVWVHRIYPLYPNLVQKFENEIKMLGGSRLKIDSTPFVIYMSYLIGWKYAKVLRRQIDIFLKKII